MGFSLHKSPTGSSKDQHFLLGHFFDGIPDPFPAQPGVFDATIRSWVAPISGNIIPNHPADFKVDPDYYVIPRDVAAQGTGTRSP